MFSLFSHFSLRIGLLVALLLLCCQSNFAAAANAKLEATLRDLEPAILNNPWSARKKLRKLRGQLDSLSRDQKLLFHLREAQALQLLNLEDEYEAAVGSARLLLRPNTAPKIRALVGIQVGLYARKQGEYEASAEALQSAAREARNNQLGDVYVQAIAELAYTYSLTDDHERALRLLQRAFTRAVEMRDTYLIAAVNEVYGAVYGYVDEFEQSIQHYEKARETYARLGFAAHEAEAIYGAGISYRYWQKWDLAIAAFEQYKEITQSRNSDHGSFTANYGLGMTYAEKGDCSHALEAIALALEAGGPKDFKAELYKRQAVCLSERGDTEEALEAIAKARAIYQSMPALLGTHWHIEVLLAEATVIAELGDYAKAFDLLMDYHQQAMALEKNHSSDRLINLRVAMEEDRKNVEIGLLKQQSAVDALTLEKQQKENALQRISITFWVVLALTAIGFLLLQRRNTLRYREMSITDALTGLYNRRHIFQLVQQYITKLPSERVRLSILLVDIDNFKAINDRFGHPVGDEVLKTIAGLGRAVLRNTDAMARIGGEEFMLLLDRTSSEQAMLVAQRLMESIRKQGIPQLTGHKVTVSVGIATFDTTTPSAAELYANADRALYQAKSAGKDRAVHYRPAK